MNVGVAGVPIDRRVRVIFIHYIMLYMALYGSEGCAISALQFRV